MVTVAPRAARRCHRIAPGAPLGAGAHGRRRGRGGGRPVRPSLRTVWIRWAYLSARRRRWSAPDRGALRVRRDHHAARLVVGTGRGLSVLRALLPSAGADTDR